MTFKYLFIGSENQKIFAIGDCCDLKEEKMALKAKDHATVISHNIAQLAANKTQLKEYKPLNMRLMLASIGRDNGIFQLGPFAFKGFVPAMIKSKDLFVPRFRQMLGYNDNSGFNYYPPMMLVGGAALAYLAWTVWA